MNSFQFSRVSAVALVALLSGKAALRAQMPVGTAEQRAILQKSEDSDARTLAAIQLASDRLSAALLRGDSKTVLSLLAPDFEVGNHQYRPQNLAWVKRVLPAQLARAQFTQLEIKLSGLESRGAQIVVHGRIEARTQEKVGEKQGRISGSYGAFWSQTPEGWQLSRDDATFTSLTSILAPLEVAPIRTDFPTQKTELGLPRENPAVVLEQSQRSQVEPIAFSPDGKTLATYGVYDRLYFSSTQSGAWEKKMATPMSINSMTYAPDGTLITGHNDGKVRLWNTKDGAMLHELEVSKWSVYAVRVSPDGKTLVVDGAGKVQFWDMKSGRKLREFGDTPGNIRSVSFSPDGKKIAFTSSAGVELWDVAQEKRVALLQSRDWSGFSAQGEAVTSLGSELRFHNLKTGKVERTVAIPNPLQKRWPKQGEPGWSPLMMNGLFFSPGAELSPDAQTAATIYQDGSIGIWDVKTGILKRQLRGFQADVMGGNVTQIAFSPDGSLLAAGSHSGETAIWTLAD